MEILKVILLAIEQGITELLPISSSAHLLLTAQVLDIKMDTYLLSVLHLGTTIALLIYFWKFLFKDILKKEKISFYIKLILSTIPAGIVGLLFESIIEQNLRGNFIIAFSLILWGVVMIAVEKKYHPKEEELTKISWKQSLAMGISQILAFIPGGSRSGITTITGMIMGINKYTALQYSFLLGLPLLFVAPIYEIVKEYPQRVLNTSDIVGILIAGVITYICLALLQKFRKKNWLTTFGIYRVILGICILIFLL